MCQSDVYTLQGGQERLLLEDVAFVEVKGDRLEMQTLFGEPVSLDARIVEIDLMKHRIVLESNDQTGSEDQRR